MDPLGRLFLPGLQEGEVGWMISREYDPLMSLWKKRRMTNENKWKKLARQELEKRVHEMKTKFTARKRKFIILFFAENVSRKYRPRNSRPLI
jgi:hypothetical protein